MAAVGISVQVSRCRLAAIDFIFLRRDMPVSPGIFKAEGAGHVKNYRFMVPTPLPVIRG